MLIWAPESFRQTLPRTVCCGHAWMAPFRLQTMWTKRFFSQHAACLYCGEIDSVNHPTWHCKAVCLLWSERDGSQLVSWTWQNTQTSACQSRIVGFIHIRSTAGWLVSLSKVSKHSVIAPDGSAKGMETSGHHLEAITADCMTTVFSPLLQLPGLCFAVSTTRVGKAEMWLISSSCPCVISYRSLWEDLVETEILFQSSSRGSCIKILKMLCVGACLKFLLGCS